MAVEQSERRPRGTDGAQVEFRSSEASLPAFPERVVDELTQFALRMLEDAITTARPASWLRRADQLEDARPRPGDYIGQATAADLAERDARLAGSAEVCRQHAELLRRYPTPLTAFERSIVAGLLEGVAA